MNRRSNEPTPLDIAAYMLFISVGVLTLLIIGAGWLLILADLVYAASTDTGHMACDDPTTTFWLCDELDRMIEKG